MLNLKKVSSKSLLVFAIALLVIGGGVYAAVKVGDSNKQNEITEITTSDGETITVKPSTNAERQDAEDNKKRLSEDNGQSAGNSVSVVITEATGGGVRAYVSGVFEDGGVCTATAVKGPETVTKTSEGFRNVSYTQCPPIDWILSAGKWTVTVNYKSSKAEGSKSTEIEV